MIFSDESVTLTRGELRALIKHSSKDETRQHVNSIAFFGKQNSAVATDGHRLAVCKPRVVTEAKWDRVLVSRAACERAVKVCPLRGAIAIDPAIRTMRVIDVLSQVVASVIFDEIKVDYPPYEKAIPKYPARGATTGWALSARYLADVLLVAEACSARTSEICFFAPSAELAPSVITEQGGGVKWTEHQIDLVRRFYAAAGKGPVDLRRLASLVGRQKANVCRKARELGLSDQHRAKDAQPSLPVRPLAPEEVGARVGEATRRRLRERGHPRGFLGKRHGAHARQRSSATAKAMWADPSSKINSPEASQERSDRLVQRIADGEFRGAEGHTRCNGGRRADLSDRYFRSSWEAN